MFHEKHESLKLLGLSGCVALWRGPSPDLCGCPMRALLLRGLGIFIGPAAVVVRPCMYFGGRVSSGPVNGEVQVGVSPLGVIILLIAVGIYAGFKVLAEEGLVRPILRALFGNWH